MLTIKSWEDTFERAETRKIKGALGWVGMPCDLNSAGLCALLMRRDGLETLGVWLLLVEYAAAKPAGKRDGTIRIGPGPLAFALRLSEAQLIRSVKALESIGWVTSTWDMPEIAGVNQASMPETPVADAWQMPDRLEKRREEERREVAASPPVSADENQPTARPADKPRVARKGKPLPPPTGTDDLLPGHIMAAWDHRWQKAFGAPYPRTSNAKEAANAKRLIAAVQRTGLTLPDIGAAMDRFNGDSFYRGKDLSVFCVHFAEFTTDRRKAPGQAERFGPDDEVWNLANGKPARSGGGDGVSARVLPDIWEMLSGDSGGVARPLLGDECVDVAGSRQENGGGGSLSVDSGAS